MSEAASPSSGAEGDRMDLHTFRASRRRKTDNLLKEDHRDLKRFFALDSAAYRDATKDGGLDEKTKELLGLVASTVLRCNDCIAYHCDRCVEVGWRKSELLDALNVALVVGGSITIPHIRTVWEVVEQLYEEKGQKAGGPARAAKLDHAAHELNGGAREHRPSTAVLTAGLRAAPAKPAAAPPTPAGATPSPATAASSPASAVPSPPPSSAKPTSSTPPATSKPRKRSTK